MNLVVNEIFYSLQGEGSRQGEPSIFIRLQGCDLTCGFCDTEFESGVQMPIEEILNHISKFPCKYIVWTGGEPALQITEHVVNLFHAAGYEQAIETNGNNKVPMNLDLVTLSPKVAEHVVEKHFGRYVKGKAQHVTIADEDLPELEVKYVRHKGQMSLPKPVVDADYYFISPQFNGFDLDTENFNQCLKLVMENTTNTNWKISIQLHKLLRIL